MPLRYREVINDMQQIATINNKVDLYMRQIMHSVLKYSGATVTHIKISSQLLSIKSEVNMMFVATRKAKNVLISLLCFISFLILFMFTRNDSDSRHAYIISATYYKSAANLPPNTMLILFTSQKHLIDSQSLKCLTKFGDQKFISNMIIKNAVPEIIECKWTPYIAQCETIQNMAMLEIAIENDEEIFVQIPFRRPIKVLYDVVTCFSPLFLNERWQLLILALEVYRYYGADMQNFYVTSMVSEVYELLKVYEKQGWVTIDAWPKMEFEHDLRYDPNEELEWRGQVVAQTDCLLKYKESAKFVIFADLDDILFPRLGNSYLSEFETLLARNKLAAAFIYKRYESYLTSEQHPSSYSILSALQTAQISTRWVDGKWVAITNRVITTAIHHPSIVHNGYTIKTVSNHTNIMAHLRTWKFLEKNETIKLTTLIGEEDMNAIESNFMETMEANVQVFDKLPNSEVYYELIEKCYNRIFYSVAKIPTVCPTHFHCTLPELPGVHCTIFNGRYEEKVLARKFRVHYSYNWYTKESNRGCGT